MVVEEVKSGCYLLFIQIEHSTIIQVGSLGELIFKPGIYVYAGGHKSALNKRVERHALKKKKVRWHIDYLTTLTDTELLYVWLFPNWQDECHLNQNFRRNFSARMLHPGFGASDCCNGCVSHLSFLEKMPSSLPRVWKKQFHFMIQVSVK